MRVPILVAVLLLLSVTYVLALEKQYEPMEGQLLSTTFEIGSDGNRVRELCVRRDSYGITSVTTSYWGVQETSCAGVCPPNSEHINSCITLSNDNNGRVRMYEILPTNKMVFQSFGSMFGNQGTYVVSNSILIGSVYVQTVGKQVFSIGIPFAQSNSRPSFSVIYRNVDGERVMAFTRMYEQSGRELLGFYGRVSGGYIVSLGFILASSTSNEHANVQYAPPVGAYKKTPNYEFFVSQSVSSRVEEICCQETSAGIRMVYVRTNSTYTSFGAGQALDDPPMTKCLSVNGRPITWESYANGYGASNNDFGGDGRLGYLRITAGSDTLLCQGGGQRVEFSRYYSGSTPRYLVGMHGYGGWEIDWVAPIWRNDPTKVALIAYKLDTAGATTNALTPKSVVEQELINNSNVDQSMTVFGTYSTTVSSTLSSEATTAGATTETLSAEASLTVTVTTDAIFTEASASVGFTFSGSTSWESSFEKTWSDSKSTTTTEEFSYEVPVTVPANSQVKANIVFTESTQDTPWQGFLLYTFPDGSTDVVQTSGVYKESKYRAISVSIE